MIEINYWGLVGLFIVFTIIGYVIGQIDYKNQIKREKKDDFQKTEEGISAVCESSSKQSQ